MKYVILLFALFLFGCTENPSNGPSSSNEEDTAPETSAQNDLTKAKTRAGNINTILDGNTFQKNLIAGKIKYYVTCENNDSSIIHIKSEGLSIREYDNEMPIEGHLVNAFSLDLDTDGYYEIYFAIDRNDGTGQLDIKGISSFNDKSAGEIYVKDIQVKRQLQSDKIYVHYDNLTREFRDENNQLQVYQYKLIKGEAGFILEPYRTK